MNNRPKIKVPFEPIDIIVEVISMTLLLLMLIYTIIEYKHLPETIPTHFNAQGIADDYSDKSMIWGLPILGIVMYAGLFIVNKFPHVHNYMVNITEENALKNYRFSTRLVRGVNFFTVVLFAYIQYTIIASAKGESITLGSWFLPIVIGMSILLPAFILSKYLKFVTLTFLDTIDKSFLSKSTTIVCSACSFESFKIMPLASSIDASIVPFIGYV